MAGSRGNATVHESDVTGHRSDVTSHESDGRDDYIRVIHHKHRGAARQPFTFTEVCRSAVARDLQREISHQVARSLARSAVRSDV